MPKPYVLAVCSHKGGTGRTTAALALAWCWGRAGLRTVLADADAVRAAGLVARDAEGAVPWSNVSYADGLPGEDEVRGADLVVIDCPSLMEGASGPALARASGVVLCCLADPLSLRTVPAAAAAIGAARVGNPGLELLGILIGVHDNRDALQDAMLAQLRDRHGELLLEPPVPAQQELRDWPMSPGADLPPGPAADAFAAVARTLEGWVRAGVNV